MSTRAAYAKAIRAAIKSPLTDADVAEIEDCMRHVIFHSTLDWQTKRQFDRGARDAWSTVQYARTPEGRKLLGETPA